jgi:hypothetical protein
LTGSEIDDVVATVLADFELALEQRRRADWHRASSRRRVSVQNKVDAVAR